MADRTQLNQYMTHLEENWANLNVLFEDLSRSGGWDKKHGADWTFADLPYHLAYCNEDILIRGLKWGSDLSEREQELLPSIDAINDWNARKFAERPEEQTAAQSVRWWRETCEEIRALAAEMNDEDLEKPFFMLLMVGWSTAREGFDFTRAHDLAEFIQLQIHMGLDEPVPSAGLSRSYPQRMLSYFPMFLNRGAAAGRNFTAVMDFTDPGVGAFTLQVVDNSAVFKMGGKPDADLVMTQSVATFVKTLNGMHDPAEAMQSGEIQVNDFGALAMFGELFPVG